MTNITKLSIASAITAFAGTACLHADDQPARKQDNDATYQLANYVVVANTYEVPLSEVGSTVEVITREDLEIGQTTFVLDALRELPGISLRNNGGPGGAFGMTTRGLNTNLPTVLIDGIEVSDPQSGRILNPGLLFSNSVERVEFLKGPQSSLYGADALAGVINITTREVKDGETTGSLSAGYGTFDTKQGSVNLQTRQGPIDFSLNLNRHESAGFSAQDNETEDDGYENSSITAKLGYQATEDLKFYLLGYYIDSESEFDASFVPSSFDPSGINRTEQFFAKTGAILQATEDWETQLGFAFSNVKTESDSVSNGFSETEGDRYKIDWRNVYSVNDDWNIAAGAEYEIEDNRLGTGDRDETSYYADNTIEVVENLHWTLGGRYDDNSAYGTNETWRTTFSYLIEPINSRLHGSYGTSFQAPSFYQTLNPTYGTPGLKAENGEGWDFGIETAFLDEKVIWDVTLFGNDISDKIGFDMTTLKYKNDESYESHGVETSLSWQVCQDVLIRTNYTYTEAEYEDGTEAERVPEHMANFSVLWSTLEEKLNLKASVHYVGKQKSLRSSLVDQDDYTVLNLAGQYELTKELTLWTSVNNVFDAEYQEISGYNSADFNMMAGIRINF
jgi:vitamin B12 transporter